MGKRMKRSSSSSCDVDVDVELELAGGSDEHEGFLPIANVGRIMKKSIPSNGKISKEAKETVKECVSEFISFITGEASDKCQREKRKTITGDDLLWAMTTLGFDSYVHPLNIYLTNYLDHDHHDKEESRVKQGDNLVKAPFGLGQMDDGSSLIGEK